MQLENVLYLLAWAGLFFVMMRFGCGAHVMGHGHSHSQSRTTPPDRAVDPVCGMNVETATAKSALYGGGVYYFCSQECRAKFGAAPAAYVKTIASALQQKETHHARQ